MSNRALASAHASVPNPGGNIRSRYKWWHEAIIDDMIAFPLDSLKTRAARLGYSIAYLSSLTNSDMFKLFYQQRRAAHAEMLTTSLTEKTAAVAGKTLDMMLETLEQKRGTIPFAVLADTAQKSLATLGYGIKPTPAVVVNNQQNTVNVSPAVTREQLADARNALLRSEAARVIEHQPAQSPRAEGASAGLLSSTAETAESVDAARLAPGE